MAIIIGTENDDNLVGTAEDDSLSGLGGNDRLEAIGGHDILEGGSGADEFVITDANTGTATLSYRTSDEGVNVAYYPSSKSFEAAGGDAQGDSVTIGNHWVTLDLIGSDHDDVITGIWGVVEGGGGADRFNTSVGTTVSYAGSDAGVTIDLEAGTGAGGDAEGDSFAGPVNVIGSSHNDHLMGSATYWNELDGAAGDDLIEGGAQGDTLSGGLGDDQLIGGGGNDTLTGGAGADLLDGGAGIWDTASYDTDTATEGVVIDLVAGTGHGGEAQGDRLVGIEVVEGSRLDDILIGDDQSNVLWGRDGDDILYGGGGDDFLYGDYLGEVPGNDILFGGAGDDNLSSRAGEDSLYGGEGDDTLSPGADADYIDGGAGNDTLRYDGESGVEVNLATGMAHGGEAEGDIFYNIENLFGTAHDDLLIGDAGRNIIRGSGGDDVVQGGDGHDVLSGGGGHDTLEGGDGNDYLRGHSNTYPRDDGPDTFLWRIFEGGAERDRVADFESGANGDRIALGAEFQEKSGIYDFEDFIAHAEETDEGLYVDFSGGRHYGYGVLIENVDLAHMSEDNVVFEDASGIYV
ncbi:calcium-binding protein [Thalassospira sp.]|uniref:calcium-binding protein n=1 Tax=Thalassospira sp. TaxID=1912094 RepID=UPI002732BA71|nr:calcium-binding protein [Thalassospira sp.]MDP2699025.1 calcium-binding protein [Thalassospira sp.]